MTTTPPAPHERNAQRALEITDRIAHELAKTAAARDTAGGTPKRERDLLRESGLLTLAVPKELGGWELSWLDTLETVRRLSQVDASVGHVYGFQHLHVATLQLFASPGQWRSWLASTAARSWFWGNALNPLDTRTSLTWRGDDGVLEGEKSFCSGARDSDMLVVSAIDAETQKLAVLAIPSDRQGLTLRDDWDNMGQRQTDSGSVALQGVKVSRAELLASPGPLGSTCSSLRPCIAQLILCNVYLGIANGALAAARTYTSEQARAWFSSGVERPTQDPYVLRHYGELFVELEAARLITDRAAQQLDLSWHRGDALTERERGETAVAVAIAKAKTTRVSLETASRAFEVMGARATTAKARVDRFWRNARTHTLHDPVDYKLRDIGAWALSETIPTPTFYS